MRLSLSFVAGLIITCTTFIHTPAQAQPAPEPAPTPAPTQDNAPPNSPQKLTAIQWEASFQAALDKARSTQKPIMVIFYAAWCPACDFLESVTCKNQQVIHESANFVNLRVNADKSKAIAARYGITVMPTIIWLNSDGKLLNGLEGVGPVQEFLQEMRLSMAQFNALKPQSKA